MANAGPFRKLGEQVPASDVAVTSGNRVPPANAGVRRTGGWNAVLPQYGLGESAGEARSDDHELRSVVQGEPSEHFLGYVEILLTDVAFHAAAGHGRRTQEVVAVGDVVEGEVVRGSARFPAVSARFRPGSPDRSGAPGTTVR